MLQDLFTNTMSSAAKNQVDSTDRERWSAVVDRDRRADGTFVYAVTSTGVFCRPGCPSRLPRRHRVRFFDTPSDAQRAGFRPCRRCRPDASPEAPRITAAVQRTARYLQTHADEVVSLKTLAAAARVSPSHLQRQFTRLLGLSPREYQAACRADRFRRELRAGRDVTSALYEAGYGSPSRVYESRPTGQGMSPAGYRQGGHGTDIGYTIVTSALGRLLVAATARGICAVKLGDSDKALEDGLRDEFPSATLRRDAIVQRAWVAELVNSTKRADREIDLPLDVRGTAFQWRVWRELQRIPFGETRSYSDVARALGQPSAARAVARACATNPVALAVPCHRVVGKDGQLSGYRWGVERKRRLLSIEAAGGSARRSAGAQRKAK
jgi:AraC family transcriptional regulator of adaptative response/methylated-DNA-[protein]-cysteine methyltransferase